MLTLGPSLVPGVMGSPWVRLVVVLLLRPVVQGCSGWKNCCCYDALRCVTGMVQVPAYHGGADRRPSNRHATQGGDDSHHARV